MADKYIKQQLRNIFKSIAKWKGFEIVAWHIGDEHIHLYCIIPPKYSVAHAIQIFKGKSSSWLKKNIKKIPKGSFWCRGYYVSTIGIDEMQIKTYINNQEHHRVEMTKLPFK
jgi:putative transposase